MGKRRGRIDIYVDESLSISRLMTKNYNSRGRGKIIASEKTNIKNLENCIRELSPRFSL